MIEESVVGRVLCDHVVEVSAAQLLLFAKATGDRLPEHVDPEAARAAGHPGLLVPPTWLFGLELMQPDPFGWVADIGGDLGRMLHGTQSFRFHAAAFAGDALRVRSQVSGLTEKKGGAMQLLDVATEVTRQGDPIAILAKTVVFLRAVVAA